MKTENIQDTIDVAYYLKSRGNQAHRRSKDFQCDAPRRQDPMLTGAED